MKEDRSAVMGVESDGDGGTRPPQSKNQRGTSPRNDDTSASVFLDTNENFAFATILKIKWPKSEENLNFGGRWVWVPMNPSPPKKISWRRP